MEHFDSVLHARMALRVAEGAGVEPARVFGEAGVPADALENPLGRVTLAQRTALFAVAERLSADPALSLRAGAAAQCEHFDVLGYAMAAQPTLREAEGLGARMLPQLCSYLGLELDEDGEAGILRVRLEALPDETRASVAEYLLPLFRTTAELIVRQPLGLQEVRFGHNRRTDRETYERIFGCTVTFGHRYDELVVRREALDLPCPNVDLGLAAVLTKHLLRTLGEPRGPADLVEQVRSLIAEHLGSADLCLETLAAGFGMKPRTLQQRLRHAGRTFTGLLDDARRVRARQLLARPDVPIAEVAYRTGFADLRSFYRAFRRWYGLTPQRWRQRRAQPGRDAAD